MKKKIEKDGIYDLNKIYAYLNSLFAKRGMIKSSDGWYENGSFTTCGSLIIKLSQTPWFMENIDEWLWFDSEDSSVEDLKGYYLKGAAIA